MKIRATELKDLPRVMEIYDYSRAFMRTNGNVTQWIGGYPSEALIRQEIEDGHSFVCMDDYRIGLASAVLKLAAEKPLVILALFQVLQIPSP